MLCRPFVLKRFKAQAGFTLLELIIVIVVLGVLAVYAVPRFSGADGYSEYTYQNSLVSVLRNMQTRAMQDSRPGYCHQINFVNNSAQRAFGPASTNYLAGNEVATCASDIDFTAPDFLRTSPTELIASGIVMTTLDNATPIGTIGFNSLGMPLTAVSNCSAGCSITFTGQSAVRVCIESQGYVNAC